MRTAVEGLLRDIDSEWDRAPLTVRIIGSTALMLQTTFARHTTDSDVLETSLLGDEEKARLLELAGPQTRLARKWGLHVQVVMRGIPFLPHAPTWRPVLIDGLVQGLQVEVLDVVDVVVSKLKRFDARDRSDIDEMIAQGHVTHSALHARFGEALDRFIGDARADDLPRYIANLHQVERDAFGVSESLFELPEWIDDGT